MSPVPSIYEALLPQHAQLFMTLCIAGFRITLRHIPAAAFLSRSLVRGPERCLGESEIERHLPDLPTIRPSDPGDRAVPHFHRWAFFIPNPWEYQLILVSECVIPEESAGERGNHIYDLPTRALNKPLRTCSSSHSHRRIPGLRSETYTSH